MKYNPLINAIEIWDDYLDAMAEMMVAVAGREVLEEEFDSELYKELFELLEKSYLAISVLQPRSKVARLNAIWKEFLRRKQSGISDKQRGESNYEGGKDLP